MLLNTGREVADPGEGLLATVAWRLGRETDYALEASVFVTGAAVQWLRDGLGIIATADETEPLARSLEGNDGVYFVPCPHGAGLAALGSLRSRHDRRPHRGGRAHLARAALEAIAYQTVDAVRAQEAAAGERLESLKADGGAAVNGG